MKKYDVVVIGSGVSGAVAALTAKLSGASVALVAQFPGATYYSSGSIDIASHADNYLLGMQDLAHKLVVHPYAQFAQNRSEKMHEALELLQQLVANDCPLHRQADGKNMLLATDMGSYKKSALVQQSQYLNLADLCGPKKVAVLGMSSFLSFDAEQVSKMLNWGKKIYDLKHIEFTALSVPFFSPADHYFSSSLDLARALDDEKFMHTFTDTLKAALKKSATSFDYLLLPPLIGTKNSNEKVRKLSDACGIECKELLATKDSVPGMRLHHALLFGLSRLGIAIEKSTVLGFFGDGSRIKSLKLREYEIEAGSVVLATGKFLGGGISSAGLIQESIFSLPVWSREKPLHDSSPSTLTGRFDERQELFCAGLKVNNDLQPLDSAGVVFAENLFAAGSIIGGYDFSQDGSGLGVCAYLGFLAGKKAH